MRASRLLSFVNGHRNELGGGCWITLRNLPERLEYHIRHLRVDAYFPSDLRNVLLQYMFEIEWGQEVERRRDEFYIPYPESELKCIDVTREGRKLPDKRVDNGEGLKLVFDYDQPQKKPGMRERVMVQYRCPARIEGMRASGPFSTRLLFPLWVTPDSEVDEVLFRIHPPKGGRVVRLNPRKNPPISLEARPVEYSVSSVRPAESVQIQPILESAGWLARSIPFRVTKRMALVFLISAIGIGVGIALVVAGSQLAGIIIGIAALAVGLIQLASNWLRPRRDRQGPA